MEIDRRGFSSCMAVVRTYMVSGVPGNLRVAVC